jgi:hypothetical protein
LSQLLVSLTGLAVAVSTVIAADTPPFKITPKRDDDRVEVKTDKDKTICSIHSPFGISNAVIERSGDKWPDAVVLRLQLKGLESFKASNGKIQLEAAISSQEGTVRLWKDGREDLPLDSTSPYWMRVRMIVGDGKLAKAIPRKDDYFELPLPRAFFEGNPKSITVSWIDFYRN